ncbi:MAG: S9 family peptidase [Saprospiraceae bacterium]|nr:S9 family peptidase [Saprospiraceae bacterium]
MKHILMSRLLLSAFLLAVCLLRNAPVSAQTPSPDNLIPRSLLFKEKTRHNVRLSSDGSTVFYQKKADGSDSTLYYLQEKMPLSEKKRRFEGKLISWNLLYEGMLTAVVQQDTSLVFYSTTLAANKMRKVNVFPFKSLTVLHTSRRFPNKIAANITAVDPTQSGIYQLDLLSGASKRLGMMEDMQQVFFDENFGMVACLRQDSHEVRTLQRKHEGLWKDVFRYTHLPDFFIGGLCKIVSVSNDGKTIYATDYTNKDKASLVAISTETGEITELASDPDADIYPGAFTLDVTGKPTSVVALYGNTRRHFIGDAVKADFEFLEKELGNLGFVGASQNDSTWLVRKMDGGPLQYFHFNRKDKKLLPLFNDYEHLNGYDMPTRTSHVVTTRDGLKLPIHVYVPFGMSNANGLPKVPLPTIIYIHGGPWVGVTHWNSWFHNRNFQLLANRGYVVINMEFRGTTGLGKALMNAGDKQFGEAMHYDIVDVAEWAKKQGIAHPKRLGIWGWSYGGYAANYALGKAPDLFAAGVSMYGLGDLPGFCKSPLLQGDSLWIERVGDANTPEGLALLEKHSPLTYVKNIKSPMLLTTGSKDLIVPQEQSDKFASELNAAKKSVVYFFYPEEGHDYAKPESWISFWAITEHFLHKNLGGRRELRKTDVESGKFEVMFGKEFIDKID